jgi:dihydroneopterin aldolase
MSFSQTTIVKVRELPLLADIGINPDEIGRRQPLVITVEAMLDSVDIDQISQTVDYRDAHHRRARSPCLPAPA